jgi:hypothetical protein
MRFVILSLALASVGVSGAEAAEPIAGPGGLKAQGCIVIFCRTLDWAPAR